MHINITQQQCLILYTRANISM